MRTLVIAGLLAATLTPTIAAAQSRELRDDRRDVREEQRDVRRAERAGAPGYVVRDERRDVREARQEYREDWQDYRRRNPDLYRGQRYDGPRGYAYRPIGVGYRFRPEYYDRRYWVDPYRYHLAPVGPGERWVRYGRDVVRIDLRSGRVTELHGGFFY